MENVVNTLAPLFLILDSCKNIRNISNKFEIQPDRTKDCGVRSMFNVVNSSLFIFYQIFILADKKDNQKVWTQSKIQTDHALRSMLPMSVSKNPHRLIIGEML